MSAPNVCRQKSARKEIDKLFHNPSNVWVVHYSCESFYDRPDGATPRITSIALRQLNSAQTSSFSIHKTAETKRISPDQIAEHYDTLVRYIGMQHVE